MSHLKNTRFVFDKYAASYKEKYLDQGNYAPVLLEFLKGIPEGGKVLDLGCGPGNISRFLLDQRSDLELTGVDIAPAMLKEARQLNPEAAFYEGNVLEIDRLVQGEFDGIISGFVLPYLKAEEVSLHLGQMAALLRSGGRCYMSFLHGDENDSGFVVSKNTDGESLYMNYHDVDLLGHLIDSIPGITLEKTFSFPLIKGKVSTSPTLRDGVKKTPRSQNGEPTNNEIMMILKWS